MKTDSQMILTDAQLDAELSRCQYCAEKSCMQACPAGVSPADFIMAAKVGDTPDIERSAALIYSQNPLAAVCGAVCPDTFCMAACSHDSFDVPVNIPALQATLAYKARQQGNIRVKAEKAATQKTVAVIGAGPSGLAVAASLALAGHLVDIFEKNEKPGGMTRLIPEERLSPELLSADLDFIRQIPNIKFHTGRPIESAQKLKTEGNYAAVVVGTGLDKPFILDIPGKDLAYDWLEFLQNSGLSGKRVAVVGGGAVAVDCAAAARKRGADSVTLVCLEKPSEMALDSKERQSLFHHGYDLSPRTRITAIRKSGGDLELACRKVDLKAGMPFHPKNMNDMEETDHTLKTDLVVFAIGSGSGRAPEEGDGLFRTGDLNHGPSTVVEAIASGKNTAELIMEYLEGIPGIAPEQPRRSVNTLPGILDDSLSLKTEFFGRTINSPFLLSAAPPSDGYGQMKKAYEAGWAGGVMKTAFDGLDIHIPGEYMFVLNDRTFGNADNVSSHPLDRVCDEISRLVSEFPDRLTMASTGGPVTGDDAADSAVWQSNTRKLEQAGAMGIEYSLSCPQGGDGTKGDIVSQDAELTAKIVDWVMSVSDGSIPKLFKLTGAVTAIYPILDAIQGVFKKYPDKKAGVTLANTFPGMEFRPAAGSGWEEGVIIGLSGEGILPISNLTLANASRFNMAISGNGGPMDYRGAVNFLALGAETVQFCSIVMKYGYGIIDELHQGLRYFMKSRAYAAVKDVIGAALPEPVTGFMDLSPVKKISSPNPELCVSCGNCTRCPYMAIQLDENRLPLIDASRCIGCSFCTKNCFAGALSMRTRTVEELAVTPD